MDSSDPSSTEAHSQSDGDDIPLSKLDLPGLGPPDLGRPALDLPALPLSGLGLEVGGSTSRASKARYYVMIFCVDALIPLALILSAISSMSILGILFVLLLYLHVFTANRIRESLQPLRICMLIDVLINFFVFIFSIVSYFIDFDQEAVRVIGLDFNNIISSSPTFTLVTSIIAMICQILSLAIMGGCEVTQLSELRSKMFGSITFQFGLDLVWACCNAFNASSNSSYLYAPILIYFIWSNICCSLFGSNKTPKIVLWIVMLYSLFFALFELYMVSYIGEKWSPSNALKYVYIAPEDSKAANVVLAVVFAYLSVQQMSAPGLTHSRSIPRWLVHLADHLLVLAFIGVGLYGLAYPNYFSFSWLVIVFVAAFSEIDTVRKVFLPFLTLVFCLSFVAMALTTFRFIDPPTIDGTDNLMPWLQLFGFFRYEKDFTFAVLGFYIVCFLGQIGRITHAVAASIAPMLPIEPARGDVADPVDEAEAERQRVLEIIRAERARQIMKLKMAVRLVFSMIFSGLIALFEYTAVGALNIVFIVGGFYEDRISFMILSVVAIVIVLCGFYRKWLFQILKFVTGGLLLLAAFYKICFNQQCKPNMNECLAYGMWGNDPLDMIQTGLVPSFDLGLLEWGWPLYVAFLLAAFLTGVGDVLERELPVAVTGSMFVIVGALHFVYVFVYETDIFTLLFVLVGTGMWSAQYIGNRLLCGFVSCLSCIIVTFQLALKYLSHFDGPRNLICALLQRYPRTRVYDMGYIHGVSGEVVLLGIILFMSTVAFSSKPTAQSYFVVRNLIFECRRLLDMLFFYVSWIFGFLFAICNDYPSFFKFLMFLPFALGRWSVHIFRYFRVPMIVFQICLLTGEFIVYIAGWDDPESGAFPWLNYLGFYFGGTPTTGERNVSVIYQLLLIFVAVINMDSFENQDPDQKWEKLLPIRLYNAFCAFLHFCLPLMVQISLCISAFLNPSIFGWLSFVVMVVVNFFPSIIERAGQHITLLFNICMLVQYLLYLGWPVRIFSQTRFNVMNNMTFETEEARDRMCSWLRWLGIYDVRQAALVTNCVSVFFFTLYLDFKTRVIDYDFRFRVLPSPIRVLVRWITTYIFEILMTVVLCVNFLVETLDGVFFFILSGILFIVTLFYDYSREYAIQIMSVGTFCAIAMHLLSRLPVFTESGSGEWVRRAFDLPFQGESDSEVPWILVYAFERLVVHIMHSDMFHTSEREHTRHMAYRFLRARQLRRLGAIDVAVLRIRHEQELEQVRQLSSQSPEEMIANLHRSDGVLGRIESKTTASLRSSSLDRSFSQTIWLTLVQPLVDFFLKLFAQTCSLNSEAGINMVTLESLTNVLHHQLDAYGAGQIYIPEQEELTFLRKLPPSVPLHLQSLLEVVGDDLTHSNDRVMLAARYILLIWRRIATPLFTLVLFIYILMRPSFLPLLLVISFLLLALPLDLHGMPLFMKSTLAISMFILAVKHICMIPFVKDEIMESINSVAVQQSKINLWSLFGLNPTESSVIEIAIFVTAVFATVDQMSQAEFFTVDYYTKRFKKAIHDFPDSFCDKIIRNPEEELHMTGETMPTLKDQVGRIFHHIGTLETSHSTWMLLVDTVSFLILLFGWATWVAGDQEASIGDGSGLVFKIEVGFVFILLIHIVFMLLLYWAHMSSRFLLLFCASGVWFTYNYCIIFFYLPSVSRKIAVSAQVFFVFRFWCALLVAHRCFVGREILAFKYPNFALDRIMIRGFDTFIRFCPFVFEINSILQWMSKTTLVPLLEFFVIRDLALQLEILIAKQMSPSYGEPPKPRTMRICGTSLLVVLLIVWFIPMFGLLDGAGSRVLNPPKYVTLELGVGDLPALYSAMGSIETITAAEHQQLADADLDNLSFMVLNSRDWISKVDFPLFSFNNWVAVNSVLENLSVYLNPASNVVVPFYTLTIDFDYPTTKMGVTQVVWHVPLPPLTQSDRDLLMSYLSQTYSRTAIATLSAFSLPLGLVFSASDNVTEIELHENVILKPGNSATFEWNLQIQSRNEIPFLASGSRYRILIWSQAVDASNWTGIAGSSGGLLAIYIVIMLVLGLLLRAFTLRGVDKLWIDRMERPQKLYRLVVATEAFREADCLDKEYDMVQRLLNTLRSQEQCLRITASDSIE